MSATLKIQHRLGVLTLTDEDIIMFRNGKFALLTQTYNQNNMEHCYDLPKYLCDRLIKEGKLYKVSHDEDNNCDFYKCSIP